VGHQHGVKPGNIVGAIANEAGLESRNIGRINISDEFSTVDLPRGMNSDTLQTLKRARICGQRLDIRPWVEKRGSDSRRGPRRAPQKRAS